MRPDEKSRVPVAGITDQSENSDLPRGARNAGGMTDRTYEAESLHTAESRDRDARFVGHEPKDETMTDDPKCEAGCISYYGGEKKHHKDCPYYPESLTKLNADRIEALLAERDALETEKQRLREAVRPFVDALNRTILAIGSEGYLRNLKTANIVCQPHITMDHLFNLRAALAEQEKTDDQ